MVNCLCGKSLKTKNEFKQHIEFCLQISTEVWDAINDQWNTVKNHSTLEDFHIVKRRGEEFKDIKNL